MRIFLIGFMGSGKSYAAKLLAEKLNLPLIDLDEFIQAKMERTISEIFENEGEEEFRDIENAALLELIKEEESFVMACGGGTPCFRENIDQMNMAGITVFLDASEALIYERIKDSGDTRPLLKNLSLKRIKEWISELRSERLVYYERAHLSLHLKADDEYEELLRYFEKFDIR